MFDYVEERNAARPTREAYAASIKAFIAQQYRQREQQRDDYLQDIAHDPEKYRRDFRGMLGFPLDREELLAEPAPMAQRLLHKTSEVCIYRVTVTVLQSIEFTGLLFLHNDRQKHPFIISQHGGGGTPEICSGLFQDGTYNYNDMTERIFRQGANVFAPQLLLWSDEYETDSFRRDDRNIIDAQLKQLGGSITALEIFCIMKALDAFCDADIAEETGIGMIGLSYGGFYTLFTAAAEPRIKAALSCSFYNKRDQYTWVDWTWKESANKFFDAETAMLVYPRYICIAVGDQDGMFRSDLAEQEFDRLRALSQKRYGRTDWFDARVFCGTHEFIQTDDPIKKVIETVCAL